MEGYIHYLLDEQKEGIRHNVIKAIANLPNAYTREQILKIVLGEIESVSYPEIDQSELDRSIKQYLKQLYENETKSNS